jgi:RNA polymerase sigma factor (sigma-70 family)
MTPWALISPARLAGSGLLRTQSDERLVDLVRAGNDRAFEAIVLRYHRQLLRHCRRLLPAGRAEDAVQQALLRALEAMRADQRELQLGPWLHRIAHNTAIDSLRRLDSHWEELDERMDGVEPTHAAVERRARFDSVVSSMGDLPERQRRALVLRELEGRSYEEIAATLGVTGAGVRQLLNRARNSMRAAASSLVPPAFVARLAGSQTGVRVAELVDPPGTSALMAKAAAAVAAGAVALLAVNGPPSGDRDHQSHANAATPPAEVEKRPDRARAARTVAATTEVARPRSRQRRAAEPARSRRGESTARSRGTSRRAGARPGGDPAVRPVQQGSAPLSRRGASIGGVADDDGPGTRVPAGGGDDADDGAPPIAGGGGGGGDDGGGGGADDDTGTTTTAPPDDDGPAGGGDSGDDAPAPTSAPAPSSAPAPTSVPATQAPAAPTDDVEVGGEPDELD